MLVQSDVDFEKLGSAVTDLRKSSILTNRHEAQRLNWAGTHLHWIRRQLRSVLFTLNLNLMCKTATVVTESTVSEVSDVQKLCSET